MASCSSSAVLSNDSVPHPAGSVDAKRDVESMLGELLLNDLIAVERKVERLIEERKKGGTDKVINERQTVFFNRLHEALNEGTPLRKLEFNAEESRELASFGLLTRKPILTVFNMGESGAAPSVELDHPSVCLMGKLEMEIAQLNQSDAALFMNEYGIEELGLSRMIKFRMICCNCNPFSPWAKTKCEPGLFSAVLPPLKRPAPSIPTCSEVLSGRRWWPMRICSRWAA